MQNFPDFKLAVSVKNPIFIPWLVPSAALHGNGTEALLNLRISGVALSWDTLVKTTPVFSEHFGLLSINVWS